jgi:cytidine deaminase
MLVVITVQNIISTCHSYYFCTLYHCIHTHTIGVRFSRLPAQMFSFSKSSPDAKSSAVSSTSDSGKSAPGKSVVFAVGVDSSDTHKAMLEEAKRAMNNAYSPYSGYKVGAAILTTEDKIFGGCNVENSSYGGTICAERTAICKAVSEVGSFKIKEVLVITDATPPWPPCGMCRQVLAEFATGDVPIHAVNLSGTGSTTLFNDLFPQAFTPEHLSK